MRLQKKLAVLMALVCCLLPLYAQELLRLTVADGLPNGKVLDFAQDRRGYLWMATEDGLARYDGFRFTTFDEHWTGLSSNELNTVLADPSGDGLFIATQRDGLCYYHPRDNRFDVWREKDGLLFDGITHMVADDDGGIWMCYYLGGMSHRAPDGTLTHYRPDDIPELTAFNWTIATDGHGTIYLGHTKKGLTVLKFEGDKVKSVRNYRSNSGADSALASDDVRTILVVNDDMVWAGTGDGLSVLNPQTGQIINYHHHAGDTVSLSDNSLQQIVKMRDGSIWITHKRGGISIVTEKEVHRAFTGKMHFEQHLNEESLEGGVNAVFEDVSGNRWVAHANEGVLLERHLQAPFTIVRREEHAVPSAGLFASGELSNALSHIVRLDRSRPLLHDYCEDGDTTWVATVEGLFCVVAGRMEAVPSVNEQLELKNINSLAVDRAGRLWLGTFGRGLYVFDRYGRLFYHDEKKSLKIINTVRADHCGRGWVGTRGGLFCFPDIFHPENSRLLGFEDGLADIFIRAIAEDEDGRLWLGCNKGISMIQTEMSADVLSSSITIHNYTHRDGLPAEEFLTGAVQMRPDGRLVFSTQNHDVIFSPRSLTDTIMPANISFSGITLFTQTSEGKERSEWYPMPERLELDYDQNTFKVSIGTCDAAQSMITEFQYRIKGLNSTWHTLENGQTEFTLFNLPYGSYELCCRSRLHNQAWSSEEIRLPIRISPPFYLTWWAKLLYVLILAALFYYLISQYVRRIQAQSRLHLEQERMTFYTNVAHELRTPLTLIVGPLEDLINENENEKVKEKLSLIHRNAQQLLTLVNQMMDVRKAEVSTRQLNPMRGNLASVVAETGLRFKELNHNPDVSLIITTDSHTPDSLFDREAVVTILNNLLSNAFKYTERGEIRLTLEQNSDKAVITVADTGFGIPSSSLAHIFDPYTQAYGPHQQAGTGLGLALVKRLAELHGGGVSVESKEGRGTTFRVKIKAPSPPQTHSTLPLEGEQGGGLLLIVEDNADIRQYIADAFKGEFTILTAPDGERGLSLAEKHIPDVIISDVMMPRMDGNAMVRRLKSDVNTSHIPVILLTAKDSMTDKEEGLESGADAYLTKPFTMKMLRSQMANLMAARRRLMQRLQQRTGTLAASTPKQQENDLHLNRLDREFLEKLDDFIDHHIKEEDLDIPRLTEALGMSQSTLYRKMKALTGLSTSDYLKKARVHHAAALLRDGCNVSEAAMLCGFNNMSYFSKVFKAEMGVLPSEYTA